MIKELINKRLKNIDNTSRSAIINLCLKPLSMVLSVLYIPFAPIISWNREVRSVVYNPVAYQLDKLL